MPCATHRPNIIVILADDMGFSDIGCYGSQIRTPHLDTMAANGMRFSQMYNCARCCPTRASLLTGLYPHQAGVGHMVSDHGVGPAYQGYLRQDCVTIGEVLRAHGYRTCYSGKWHASPGVPLPDKIPPAPIGSVRNPSPYSRGFDHFYGTMAGCGSYFTPHGLMEQDAFIRPEPQDFYYTDAISTRACRMIEGAADAQEPFFLHVCYTAPHWPLHAHDEDIERYRGRFTDGWDTCRTRRHEELKHTGLVDTSWTISARDDTAPDFSSLSAPRREWEDLRMAVYAAQIECMDRGIGRILDTLRKQGLEENTMVMFLSDNGGCAEFLREDGEETTWPGFYRYTAPPGQECRVGNIEGLAPGPATTFMSYDLPWAHASNSPFRLYKHWVHEGGIATPFIVQWPRTVEKGALRHRPCHVMDIMATCIDITGASYPRTFKGHAIQPCEGESFAPVLTGPDRSREMPLFWEHEGNCAVRDGAWKLVKKHPGAWELYNMHTDRTEVHDLAAAHAPKARQMLHAYQDWAHRCEVREWPLH